MGEPRGERAESIESTVIEILRGSGVTDPAPHTPLRGDDTDFMRAFCLTEGCVPYRPAVVDGLTVREFSELHVNDSYPPPPVVALDDHHYDQPDAPEPRPDVGPPQPFPLGFVLGAARSGTTLLQAMLNSHPRIWAPGELHLAGFDGMAGRAAALIAPVRYGLVSEVAERLGESKDAFAARLAEWERQDRSVSSVYRRLHDADPQTLVVDKTPPYSAWLRDLERINAEFTDARFVHLVRNPHDVIRSHVRMQLYKAGASRFEPSVSPYQMAEIGWYRHNTNIEAFFAGIAENRRCRVRYEDLVASPAAELEKVCAALGVAFEPAMADPYAHRDGRVARGAGDVRVNALARVENRPAGDAFYPLGDRCRELAAGYGYAI